MLVNTRNFTTAIQIRTSGKWLMCRISLHFNHITYFHDQKLQYCTNMNIQKTDNNYFTTHKFSLLNLLNTVCVLLTFNNKLK